MDTITSIMAVFGASVMGLWLGVPLGFILNLNPLIIAIISAGGSILSAFIIIIPGDSLRKWFVKWRYGDSIKKWFEWFYGNRFTQGRISNIWNKYGIIGLGLLSPLLFGAHFGAALGVGLAVPRYQLLLWMSIGIIIWSFFLTFSVFFGLMSFQSFVK